MSYSGLPPHTVSGSSPLRPGRSHSDPAGVRERQSYAGAVQMNVGPMAVLPDSGRLLVAETESAQLAGLDEDEAVALETRVRRARNKYTGQYRRMAAVRVPEQGGRGMARPQNRRAAMKAEAFEDALARVSRRVAV